MKTIALAALTLLSTSAFGKDAKEEVRTTPASDGYLCGKKEKMMDQVCSTALEVTKYRSNNSIMIGHIWRASFKGIIEFPLPNSIKEVKSATLTLYTLGKTGCYQRKSGGGPKVEMYYYFSPEANGKVELSDSKIGTKVKPNPLKGGETVPQNSPLKIDVTDIVKKAVAAKSEWLGLRFETPEKSNSAWCFVAADNPNNKTGKMSPKLTITFTQSDNKKKK